MNAIEKLIDSLFCETLRRDLAKHFGECEHCRKGLVTFVDEIPMLGMMLPGEVKQKLKELQHGNGAKGR